MMKRLNWRVNVWRGMSHARFHRLDRRGARISFRPL